MPKKQPRSVTSYVESQLPDSKGVSGKRDGRRKKGAGGALAPHKGGGSQKRRRKLKSVE